LDAADTLEEPDVLDPQPASRNDAPIVSIGASRQQRAESAGIGAG